MVKNDDSYNGKNLKLNNTYVLYVKKDRCNKLEDPVYSL